MAKRVFFSFYYEDVKSFRANVVRNHWLTKDDAEDAGFFDASIWETSKRHGDDSVKRLINDSLQYTSVTCALIGSYTWSRRWVRYEILKSYDRGNTLFGVHINSIKDKEQTVLPLGPNVFNHLGFTISSDGNTITYFERDSGDWRVFSDLGPNRCAGRFDSKFWGQGYTLGNWVPVYDWIANEGYNNFADWAGNTK